MGPLYLCNQSFNSNSKFKFFLTIVNWTFTKDLDEFFLTEQKYLSLIKKVMKLLACFCGDKDFIFFINWYSLPSCCHRHIFLNDDMSTGGIVRPSNYLLVLAHFKDFNFYFILSSEIWETAAFFALSMFSFGG